MNVHLDQELSIFLYILVSRLLLLFLLRLHWDVDVHSQFLTTKRERNDVAVKIRLKVLQKFPGFFFE